MCVFSDESGKEKVESASVVINACSLQRKLCEEL